MARSAPTNNRLVVVLVAVGIASLVAVVAGWALNRDDADPEDRWADAVCGALRDWKEGIDVAAASVRDAVDEQGVIGAITTLDDAYFDVRDATVELAEELRAIGAPETEAGREARDQLRQLAERLDALDDQLLNAAGSTDTIVNAEQLIGLGEQVIAIVDDLGRAQSDVQVALRESAECRALASDA